MLKRDAKNRKGNDQFEGYGVDLIRHVAEMLEFDYELYLVPDGKFGSMDDHGNWNGMMGELLSGVGNLKNVLDRDIPSTFLLHGI